MGLMTLLIVVIAITVVATIFIKSKPLTEAEKQLEARKRLLERDRLKSEENARLEINAKKEIGVEITIKPNALIEEQEESVFLKEEALINDETLEENKKPLNEVIKGKIRKSRPITMNEQPTFQRLREALEPEFIVLAQVSFSAILWTRYNSIRNRFNRKIVDFVICDKSFNVIAAVELDDSSHKGKEQRDEDRDTLLQEAGIPVIRYKKTPDISQVKSDFETLRK